jgi:probable rRNA maturation factor
MITIEPPRRLSNDANPWTAAGLSQRGLSDFLRKARRKIGLKGDVDVMIASDRTLRNLNRDFRGKDKATDVLSFPAPPDFPGNRAGDLAISLETAARQADAYQHEVSDEIRILIVHGLLHLAGMNHETDSGEMAEREAAIRSALRLPSGLIERTSAPRRRKVAA